MRIHYIAVACVMPAALGAADGVSYYNDIRPLLQVHCSGCHQAANKMGGLEITSYAGILKGGAKHGSSVAKGAPENSPLLKLVTGQLEPRMPMGGTALPADVIELITTWVREGAEDDTPVEAKAPQVPAEPPKYAQAPTITAMSYSPDGNLLAVGGFHEILLLKANGSGIEGPPPWSLRQGPFDRFL